MRIDAHQHFWKFDPRRDSWITDEMSILKRDFSPEDLAPELAARNIDGSVAVQTAQSEEETSYLLELAAHSTRIAGVVGWVDMLSARAEERLRYFSKFERLRGFRHIVQSEPDDRFLLNPDFLRGIRLLRKFDFTYDILIYPRQLPAAVEFAARFPEQRFVIDHMAKPEIKARKTREWAAQIRLLAANPNVFCKVSGLVTEAEHADWKPSDLKPYLDIVFEVFGEDRLMYGSDWPVCLLAGSYERVYALVDDYTRSLGREGRAKFFGGNAARFYGVTDEPPGGRE